MRPWEIDTADPECDRWGVFQPTKRQLPLFGAEAGLADSARSRLRESWAEAFRQEVMPELLESEGRFAKLYGEKGRPNWSVARLLGLCFLQQIDDLSDQNALDALSFDLRWQHALGVSTEEAYLSRRSLVEFRRRLVKQDPDGVLIREVFDRVCAAGVKRLSLSTAEQRLDSTLICSDIRNRGRLSLAREVLRVFIRSLDEGLRAQLPEAVRCFYDAEDGRWEATEKAKEAKQRLVEVGEWIAAVLEQFAQNEKVAASEPYQLLARMLAEHAPAFDQAVKTADEETSRADDDDNQDRDSDTDAGGSDSGNTTAQSADSSKSRRGKNRAKRERRAKKRRKKTGQCKQTTAPKKQKARFWSPHDPDASFGHKGLGYHAHLTETCRNPTAELITDYEVVTAAQSDVGQARFVVERLRKRGLAPEILYSDGGYPTPSDLVECRSAGTELWAPVNRGRLPAGSFSRMDFTFDADGRVTRCPAGHAPTRHGQRSSSDAMNRRRSLHVFFDNHKCRSCEHLHRCPVRTPNNAKSREYRLELSAELMARDRRWVEQHTRPWQKPYQIRAGVEATMSEMKRAHGVGRLRVRRMARVRLQVAFKATACNIKRWARVALARANAPDGALRSPSRPLKAIHALLTAILACWAIASRRVHQSRPCLAHGSR
jgi:hypothetical protein